MGLPRTLQNFNAYIDGTSYYGEATEMVLPKLTRKTEDGPNGIKIDLGLEPLELEHTYAGIIKGLFDGFGAAKVDAALIRFVGAYDNPATGEVETVEVVVRGRHTELDTGTAKAGEKSEVKVKTACVYYKLSINSAVVVEIDRLNDIEIINGTDRSAARRAAIGL